MSHKHSYVHLQQANNYDKMAEIKTGKRQLSTEIFFIQFSLGLPHFYCNILQG